MEEALRYLEAIEQINRAERAVKDGETSERLEEALREAQLAWSVLPRNIQDKMAPPTRC